MPEYLAPGVYVEETNTGNKPIEGVSTSTAGLVGVTERGPVNVPMLVTSYGDFGRVFGGKLEIDDFTDATGRPHCYLPHAVEGFFTNGGKRAYVVRVAPQDAGRASRQLFNRGALGGADLLLARHAAQGTGTAVNAPTLFLLDPLGAPVGAALAVGESVRVGDGSSAEYPEVAAIDASRHVALNFALSAGHAAGAVVLEIAPSPDATNYTTGAFVLAADSAAGDTTVDLTVADAADVTAMAALPGNIFRLGSADAGEYVTVTAAQATAADEVRLTLLAPLVMSYEAGADVTAMEIDPAAAVTTGALGLQANAGDMMVHLETAAPFTAGNLVAVDTGTSMEVRRLGRLSRLPMDLGAYADYPAGSIVRRVTMGDARNVAASSADDAELDEIQGLAPGMTITFDTGDAVIAEVEESTGTVTFQSPIAAPTVGTAATIPAKLLTADIAEGGLVLSLDDRLGLDAGDVLRLGTAPDEEYAVIATVPGERGVAPDAGTVVLTRPTRQAHAAGAEARRMHDPEDDASRQPALLFLASEEDAEAVLVNEGTNYAADEVVRITLASGGVFYHRLDGDEVALAPSEVTLAASDPLERSHDPGETVVERQALLDVEALDVGAWGNRLLVTCQEESSGLASRAEVTALNPVAGPGTFATLSLTTFTGVEAGSLLELQDPGTREAVGDPLKVRSVDRAAGLAVLDSPGPGMDQLNAHAAALAAGTRLLARSREFRLQVLLKQRPDPAVPSRNDTIIDREDFRHLSMDSRHSRYLEKVIGDIDGDLRISDRRPEGESAYIRVRDLAADTAEEQSVRVGPEALADLLPSGQTRAARHALSEGTDSADTMGDAMYQGDDDDEPELRTGIFALKNLLNIALTAVPGQTTAAVQQALIDHCEEQRYRFAVLDAQGPTPQDPTRDTLADVQTQRQQFDTKYAAIYHPWITIPDPMPDNLANIRQFPVPPSGHVLGIYARTDIERGVHKAPANETVRGLTGLTRSLNKAEQDILNAFPVHINVIRDFRINNRGIRVWGARCITSDSDYKYVNVRRLLIFLEDSIDRGLQWVVFEPNNEELWARVRRSIGNFLTVVWRNGALEGTSPDQGFFVKCDRTTMTQTDIDNGRLICVVGVAPVKPAEFVIIRIGLWTSEAQE